VTTMVTGGMIVLGRIRAAIGNGMMNEARRHAHSDAVHMHRTGREARLEQVVVNFRKMTVESFPSRGKNAPIR